MCQTTAGHPQRSAHDSSPSSPPRPECTRQERITHYLTESGKHFQQAFELLRLLSLFLLDVLREIATRVLQWTLPGCRPLEFPFDRKMASRTQSAHSAFSSPVVNRDTAQNEAPRKA